MTFEDLQVNFDLKCQLHGSIWNGTYDNYSDCDVVTDKDLKPLMNRIITFSTENKRYSIVRYVHTACVPVLKIRDQKHCMDIDIINRKDDKLYREKGELIQLFVSADSRMLTVFRILKDWRRDHIEYFDPRKGFPNNYGFQIILLYVLIKKGVLPLLDPKKLALVDVNGINGDQYNRDSVRLNPVDLFKLFLQFLTDPFLKEIVNIRELNRFTENKDDYWYVIEPISNEPMNFLFERQPEIIADIAKNSLKKIKIHGYTLKHSIVKPVAVKSYQNERYREKLTTNSNKSNYHSYNNRYYYRDNNFQDYNNYNSDNRYFYENDDYN